MVTSTHAVVVSSSGSAWKYGFVEMLHDFIDLTYTVAPGVSIRIIPRCKFSVSPAEVNQDRRPRITRVGIIL